MNVPFNKIAQEVEKGELKIYEKKSQKKRNNREKSTKLKKVKVMMFEFEEVDDFRYLDAVVIVKKGARKFISRAYQVTQVILVTQKNKISHKTKDL